MTLDGNARESNVIPAMEELLRDERHTVISGPSREREERSALSVAALRKRSSCAAESAAARGRPPVARHPFAPEGPDEPARENVGPRRRRAVAARAGLLRLRAMAAGGGELRDEISSAETAISDKESADYARQARGQRLKQFEAAQPARRCRSRPLALQGVALDLAESKIKLASPVVTPGTITPRPRQLSAVVDHRGRARHARATDATCSRLLLGRLPAPDSLAAGQADPR